MTCIITKVRICSKGFDPIEDPVVLVCSAHGVRCDSWEALAEHRRQAEAVEEEALCR